jgi:hypothetical protein
MLYNYYRIISEIFILTNSLYNVFSGGYQVVMEPSVDQHFKLRWPNYRNNLTDTLRKLFQRQILADVTLACDGEIFRAHQTILTASSPYFESIFLQNTHPHPIIFLRDVNYSEMKALLQFMYEGEVEVKKDRLPVFLKTAEALQINGLSGNELGSQKGDKFIPISVSSPATNFKKQCRYNSLLEEKSSGNAITSGSTRQHNHPLSQVQIKINFWESVK